jgi:peptidoglycan/xylan/chitin deacetylase (PgdA/CDA1 family)
MVVKILIYLLVGLIILYLLSKILHKLATTKKYQFFGELVTNVNTTEKVVAFTYDDGPHPSNTNQLLDILDKFQAKATFFAIGKNIEKYPEIIQNILAQGHEVGNHSYSHLPMIFRKPSFINSEIEQTDRLLRQLGVNTDIHFRPPFGLKRLILSFILEQKHKKNILWNLDPKDCLATNPESIESYVITNIKPGAIILLHDGGGDRTPTVKATEFLLQNLQEKGYKFMTVSELLTLKT